MYIPCGTLLHLKPVYMFLWSPVLVPQYLYSPVSVYPGPIFPSLYVSQSICSPIPVFPSTYVPRYLCPPVLCSPISMFPSLYVYWFIEYTLTALISATELSKRCWENTVNMQEVNCFQTPMVTQQFVSQHKAHIKELVNYFLIDVAQVCRVYMIWELTLNAAMCMKHI